MPKELDIDARLDAATGTVLAEISRTDAKSGVLLTSFSLPLAALVAAVPGKALPGASAVLVGVGTVGLVAAMLVVLLVVRPRLGGAARGSFLYWSLCTADELLADLQAPADRATHVVHLSRIAKRKYRGLRLAGDITAASLVALAAALLTALI
ncbi:Pycsar system effector family protein [Streptomyces pseudogriseolus]|uniref:Pycsar system effector family protein n=1 Tax=Streptomyces pseudogriseolus TaxID=36817 RepID=UPI003FA1B3CA